MVDCFPDLSFFFVLSTENPSMMKNTQNLNSKYFNHRADKHSMCVFFNIMHLIILAVLFDHHIFRHAVCNMRTNCDSAVGSVRKCVQKRSSDQSTKFFADCGFDVQRIDRWMFFDSVLNTLPQIHCMRVIHSGLIFADVQYQQATNPSTD